MSNFCSSINIAQDTFNSLYPFSVILSGFHGVRLCTGIVPRILLLTEGRLSPCKKETEYLPYALAEAGVLAGKIVTNG
jgi:hypothetical protein